MITKLFTLCGYNVLMSKHPFNDNRKNVHVAISELFWESSFFYFFSNSEDNFNPTFLVCSLLVDTFLLFFSSAFYVTPGHMKYFYNEKLLLRNLKKHWQKVYISNCVKCLKCFVCHYLKNMMFENFIKYFWYCFATSMLLPSVSH